MALLPHPVNATKGTLGTASAASGWFFAVNGQLTGEKLEAAKKLAFDMVGPGYARKICEGGAIGPIKVEGVDYSSFPALQQDYIMMANSYIAVPVYDVVLTGTIVDILNAGLQEVLAGTKTPADLAVEIQAEQEKLMK